MKELNSKLIKIQSGLKAPKNQTNSFGGYKYRSAEDILEAVKPLLKEQGVSLTISDDIVAVGDRIYVKATATLSDGTDIIQTVAFAREPASKKGADESQITGATSSYSRKYALGGLLCIDDTKDADATNTHGKDEQKSAPEKKDCPGAIYWKLIKMDVEGVKDKKGRTGLEYYKANYNPSEEDIKKFDSDLQMARDARETQDFLDLDESAQNPKNKK